MYLLCAPFIGDEAVAYVALALPELFIDPLPIGGRIEVFKITVGLRGEVYLRDVVRPVLDANKELLGVQAEINV